MKINFFIACVLIFSKILLLMIISPNTPPPPFKINSLQQVSQYLNSPFKNEKLKARVLYIWMHKNLEYDFAYCQEVYKQAITSLGAVRQNDLCWLCPDISGSVSGCWVGSGSSRGLLKIDIIVGQSTPHAWNKVKIYGKWYLIDATLGDNISKLLDLVTDFYFLADHQFLQYTHFPNNPAYQLLAQPVRWEEFQRMNGKLGNPNSAFRE